MSSVFDGLVHKPALNLIDGGILRKKMAQDVRRLSVDGDVQCAVTDTAADLTT